MEALFGLSSRMGFVQMARLMLPTIRLIVSKYYLFAGDGPSERVWQTVELCILYILHASLRNRKGR